MLSAVALAAALAVAVLWRDARDAFGEAARQLRRAEHAGRERALMADAERQLAALQTGAETGVALGAGAVRAIHRGIAAIPFTILEAIPGVGAPARAARVVHDGVAGSVYGAIGLANRAVGLGLRRLLKLRRQGRQKP